VHAGAEALRDPTRPLAGSSARARQTAAGAVTPKPVAVALPQLQLVLIGPERSVVVIDGELLTKGQSFNGLEIMQILPEAVVLKAANGLRTLPLAVAIDNPPQEASGK
jgi:hypothetical protein